MNRSVALAAISLALVACNSTEKVAPKPKEEKPVRVDRGVIRAFRTYLYVGYDARLSRELPRVVQQRKLVDPAGLEERQALTRKQLEESLLAAGAKPERLKTTQSLVDLIRRGIQRGGRYLILLPQDDDSSFSVVRVRKRAKEREVVLFGESFAYKLTVYDETLIYDYPTYRASKLGQPMHRVATYRGDGVVCIDLEAARWVGEKQFFPFVQSLRKQARSAADPRAFLARKERLAEILTLTKNSLRWRSLEALWSMIANRPRDERLRRFATDYAERAELRAVAELRELNRLQRDPKTVLSDEELMKLFMLGSLSAAIHGDPLGQMADVLALATMSLPTDEQEARHEPHFRAARQIVLDMVALIRKGKASNEADAQALAQLARMEADTLRDLARAILKARTK